MELNKILQGDCLEVLKTLPENSVDSIVTDPPYELGFMGKYWDNTGIANNPLMWAECLRVLKQGGHLLSFGGTRTYHRMAVAIEDAGFEVRDQIAWCYGQGFPKSLNVFKQLKKKCECGNMEVYENRTQQVGANSEQEAEYFMRFMQESNLSQTKHLGEKQGEVLQSCLSEQSSHSTVLREESKESSNGGEERILEGGNNLQKTEGELQGSDLPEVSEGVSTNGEERRIHNATQVSDGSTPKKIIDENGSGASHRPQSEQQQYREPCAFCKQWGTQATRTLGVGTALKPSIEPICVARKPIEKGLTVAENCLKYGTGGINIDESRVGTDDKLSIHKGNLFAGNSGIDTKENFESSGQSLGRFPANLIHDNTEEVRECFPETGKGSDKPRNRNTIGSFGMPNDTTPEYSDSGNASRFFKSIIYQAKASKSERNRGCEDMEEKAPAYESHRANYKTTHGIETPFAGAGRSGKNFKNNHPTVKPITLMEYLIKMVTPKGGIVLDPFAGSGSTLVAAKENGFNFIGIEMTAEYIPIIEARLKAVKKDLTLF